MLEATSCHLFPFPSSQLSLQFFIILLSCMSYTLLTGTFLTPCIGRVNLSWVHFSCLASRLQRSACLNCAKNYENGESQGILSFLKRESVKKQENDKIPWIRKVSGNRKTTKSFEYRKNLETGNWQNPLNTERVWKQENDKILWIRKESGNRKMTKSFAWAKTWLTRGTDRPFRCLDLGMAPQVSKTSTLVG